MQDEKELNILKGSKNVFEYGFWMDKARALYHRARYEALVVYMKELGLKVPTKYGELVLPEKPKNLFFKKKGKKKNCWQPISDFSVDAAYAHYMGVAS